MSEGAATGGARAPWARPEFVRAAHYFADGWPLDSLLVMRRRELRRDFRALRGSGFNTVVLVVPWQGFQTSQDPPSYDPVYPEQLRMAMGEARRAGLAVLLRVSYVHQIMPEPTVGGVRIVQGLLIDERVRRAWLDYHATLHALARAFDNCIGLFVSWEELWHTFAHWQKLSLAERRELAGLSGFRDWAKERGADGDDADVIPEREAPAYGLYHRFCNERFRSLLEAAREVSPMLGVEFRVDRDPLHDGDRVRWLQNDPFHDWEPVRYSYWAPFVGSQNVGEALACNQALTSLEAMLETTSDGGRLPGQVIEQFNFVDDTLQYADSHAAIAPDEVPRFLEAAAPRLRDRCGGYGLWAVRDYRCNILYNAAFQCAARGWHREKVSALRDSVLIRRSGVLAQHIAPGIPWIPLMHPFSEIELEIQCGWLSRLLRPRLRAQLNRGGWAHLVDAGGGRWRATLPVDFDSFRSRGLHFKIENDGGPVQLLRVQLYRLVYRGGVHRVDGTPGPYAEAVRRFNALLGA